jgi:Ca2+-binding RTX toxin-like protein
MAARATTRSPAATVPRPSSAAAGNDFVDGNIGADTAELGTGNDSFQWDPGDGSDTVDGQSGKDTLAFNGSNIGEQIGVAANGSRVRLTRDVAGITMDLNGIESTAIRTLGSATPSPSATSGHGPRAPTST